MVMLCIGENAFYMLILYANLVVTPEIEWLLCITVKPFKFLILCTTHVRKPGPRANRKFRFYGCGQIFGGINCTVNLRKR